MIIEAAKSGHTQVVQLLLPTSILVTPEQPQIPSGMNTTGQIPVVFGGFHHLPATAAALTHMLNMEVELNRPGGGLTTPVNLEDKLLEELPPIDFESTIASSTFAQPNNAFPFSFFVLPPPAPQQQLNQHLQ